MMIGPRKTATRKKATAYAKSAYVEKRTHEPAEASAISCLNEFPRFIIENDKHSRVNRIMLQY